MTQHSQSVPATSRRAFLTMLTMAGTHALTQPMFNAWAQGTAPALVTPDTMRPAIPYGVASGDVTSQAAIIWSRTDRPAQLIVEYATTESMRQARRARGPAALEANDYTAKLNLTGLPAGQRIFYRVYFEDLAHPNQYSEPVIGSFLMAPKQKRDLHFAWSGDTAGQGFGINPDWGGMKIYDTMHRMQPDFFIHSGDYIYADGPIPAEIPLDNGGVWKNLTTPEKAKVAETLAEFRGNYVYNLLDEHVRRFNAAVPQLVQWDDHETTNNWYPGEQLLDDDRYTVKSASLQGSPSSSGSRYSSRVSLPPPSAPACHNLLLHYQASIIACVGPLSHNTSTMDTQLCVPPGHAIHIWECRDRAFGYTMLEVFRKS